MAYGVKYQLYCKAKDGVTSKAVISEDGYADAEIDRNVPINPFHLRKDAAAVICGTSFEFLIKEEVDFEFLEFYTNAPKKFKVEFYWPSDTLIWSGWLNTQQYSVPYKPGKTNVRFQATDGLGLLKNEPFTLTGLNSEIAIIKHCVDKIGLGIQFSVAIGLYEVNHTYTNRALEETYIDCDTYSDWMCYDILAKLLGKYDATITQWNNKWKITSYKDKKATRVIYTSAGVYSTTEAAPAVLDLGVKGESGVEVYPINYLELSLKPGYKKIDVLHDFGLKESVLENYLFTRYASSMFTDWTKGGIFPVSQQWKDGECYAWLQTYSNVDTDYIEQSQEVIYALNENFIMAVDVCPVGRYWSGSYSGMNVYGMEVRMLITLVTSSTTYYLTTDGWTETPTYFTQTIDSSIWIATIVWTHIEIISDLPDSGTLTVRLMRFKSGSPGSGVSYSGVAWKKPCARFVYAEEDFENSIDQVATIDDSTEPQNMAAMDFMAADAPVYQNNELMYEKITRLSTNIPTSKWHFTDNDTNYTLVYAYLKMLASRNITARQVLTGIIKGATIGFENLIKHAYNSNREFEIYQAAWDVYEAKFSVTLIEFLAFTDQDLTLDDGTTIEGFANLTVATVTPNGFAKDISTGFNTTVHIDNTGETAGRGTINWKIVNGSDETQSSGNHTSGDIAGDDDEDHIVAMVTPAAEGTYYVKCKMALDTSWVTSSAITVEIVMVVTLNHVDSISNGTAGEGMSVSFEATVTGEGGTCVVYWEITNSGDVVVDSGYEDVVMTLGTDTYGLGGILYPAAGTGYVLSIGLDAESMTDSSNGFNSTE